jgi:hypothetical protein
MGVQYDRAKVESWFNRLCDELGSMDLSQVWLQLAYTPDGPVDISPTDFWDEWCSFSLWEKQLALYLFVPRIEKNASHQAWLLSQRARTHEPL